MTFTKEQAELHAFITGFLSDPMHNDKSATSMTAKVFRVALAALTAEPAIELKGGKVRFLAIPVDGLFYSAPTAPVVPDALPKLKDGQRFKYVKDGIRYSANYANGWNACRAAMLQGAAGNSPAIPDGWVACSERMPEGMLTVITSNGFDIGQAWWDGEGWNSFDCHDVVPGAVTHWMPLPAAPKTVK